MKLVVVEGNCSCVSGGACFHSRVQFGVEHLGLAAREPATLKDWYARVLGAETVFETGTTPPAFFLRLTGGLVIEIYQGAQVSAATGDNTLSGWRHLALQVASIETARTELTARGVSFNEPIKPAGGGGRVLFFKDAEGNLLHLIERTADSQFYR